jgi:hypothetical protein
MRQRLGYLWEGLGVIRRRQRRGRSLLKPFISTSSPMPYIPQRCLPPASGLKRLGCVCSPALRAFVRDIAAVLCLSTQVRVFFAPTTDGSWHPLLYNESCKHCPLVPLHNLHIHSKDIELFLAQGARVAVLPKGGDTADGAACLHDHSATGAAAASCSSSSASCFSPCWHPRRVRWQEVDLRARLDHEKDGDKQRDDRQETPFSRQLWLFEDEALEVGEMGREGAHGSCDAEDCERHQTCIVSCRIDQIASSYLRICFD